MAALDRADRRLVHRSADRGGTDDGADQGPGAGGRARTPSSTTPSLGWRRRAREAGDRARGRHGARVAAILTLARRGSSSGARRVGTRGRTRSSAWPTRRQATCAVERRYADEARHTAEAEAVPDEQRRPPRRPCDRAQASRRAVAARGGPPPASEDCAGRRATRVVIGGREGRNGCAAELDESRADAGRDPGPPAGVLALLDQLDAELPRSWTVPPAAPQRLRRIGQARHAADLAEVNDAGRPSDRTSDRYPEFRTVRRGYDPDEVERVLDELYTALDDAAPGRTEQTAKARRRGASSRSSRQPWPRPSGGSPRSRAGPRRPTASFESLGSRISEILAGAAAEAAEITRGPERRRRPCTTRPRPPR